MSESDISASVLENDTISKDSREPDNIQVCSSPQENPNSQELELELPPMKKEIQNGQNNLNDKPKIIRIEEAKDGKTENGIILTELMASDDAVMDANVAGPNSVDMGADIKNIQLHDEGTDGLMENLILKDEKLLEAIQGLPESTTQVVLYQCNLCSKYVSSKDELDSHLEDVHNLFICKICEKEFSERSELLLHSREHPKAHKCDICNKTFTRAFHVKRHMKLHEDGFAADKKNVLVDSSDEKIHNCETCGKFFTSSHSLKLHKMFHTGEKCYYCDMCEEGFVWKSTLRRHKETKHLGSHPYKCNRCRLDFATEKELKEHNSEVDHSSMGPPEKQVLKYNRKKYQRPKAHQCHICGVEYAYESYLLDHQRIHTGEKTIKCTVCNEEFMKAILLRQHMKTHQTLPPKIPGVRPKTKTALMKATTATPKKKKIEKKERHQSESKSGDNSPPVCQYCQKTFSTRSVLNVHIRSHTGEKPYSCDICGKGFAISSSMKAHRRVHTGEKPYYCEICDKHFAWNRDMARHKRRHLGIKPYVCDVCGKAFSDDLAFRDHKTIHTGVVPYKCNICGRGFRWKKCFVIHKRTHTGERPYACSHCNKAFAKLSTLKSHLSSHTGQKLYKCHICGKEFGWEKSFSRHLVSHTGVKQHKCPFCHKEFTQSANLSKHVRVHIGDGPLLCDVCGQDCSTWGILKEHKKTHHGIRPSLDHSYGVGVDDENQQDQAIEIILSDDFYSTGSEVIAIQTGGENPSVQPIVIEKSTNSMHVKNSSIDVLSDGEFQDIDTEDVDSMMYQEGSNEDMIVAQQLTSLPTMIEIEQTPGKKRAVLYNDVTNTTTPKHANLLNSSPGKDEIVVRKFPTEKNSAVVGSKEKQNVVVNKTRNADGRMIYTLDFEGNVPEIDGSNVYVHTRDDHLNTVENSDTPSNQGNIINAAKMNTDNSTQTNLHVPIKVQNKSVDDNEQQMYMNVVLKKSKCNVCGVECPTEESLARHKKHHLENRPFECKICGKTYGFQKDLRRHVKKSHGDSKPYNCEECGRGFTDSETFRAHQRLHTGEMPYHCTFCPKVFRSSKSLILHKRTHTGEKPYKCDFCDKRFAKTSHRKSHLKVHTGEKPYKCEVCGKEFGWDKSFARHKLTHTGIKPYTCNVCGKSFTQSGTLNTHIKTCYGTKKLVTDSNISPMGITPGNKPVLLNMGSNMVLEQVDTTALTEEITNAVQDAVSGESLQGLEEVVYYVVYEPDQLNDGDGQETIDVANLLQNATQL